MIKFRNILLGLAIFSLSISSEDVLNETVYWELTRVDAKIEEKNAK